MKYIFILFICFFFIFCKKTKKDVLPAATQEGKNTFGCLLNDVVWLPKSSVSIYQEYSNINGGYDPSNKTFGIQAAKRDKYPFENINIYSKNITGIGTYRLYLNYDKTSTAYSFSESKQSNKDFFLMNDTINSVLTIKRLDTLNYIISGSFSFDFIKATAM